MAKRYPVSKKRSGKHYDKAVVTKMNFNTKRKKKKSRSKIRWYEDKSSRPSVKKIKSRFRTYQGDWAFGKQSRPLRKKRRNRFYEYGIHKKGEKKPPKKYLRYYGTT